VSAPDHISYKDLCLDAVDVTVAVDFWSHALALSVEHRGDLYRLVDGVGEHTVWINPVLDPKTVKNRVHLDVRVGTGLVGAERLAALEAECARLVELGAVRVRLLPAADGEESCIVMQDIEGNEFCLD